MRVLVVEDTAKMAELLRRGLTEEGYAVDVAASGAEAMWLASETDYDAVLLDVVLDASGAGMDGFEVCRRMRDAGRWSPVVMVTARDGVPDRVRGLDLGADDYLVKPFAFAELVARLRAATRRGGAPRPAVLTAAGLRLDPARHEVCRDGVPVGLTAKEFALLECFMRRPGETLTRAMLIEAVWDFAYEANTNVVDVHIRNLRTKIGTSALRTVRGVGYQLCDDAAG